jgi:hypothetical protein
VSASVAAPLGVLHVFCIAATLVSLNVMLNTCVLCSAVHIIFVWNVEQSDGSVESTFIFRFVANKL